MENNENLVVEQTAENAEHTAEESLKTYTEAEFNAKLDEVLSKKLARREAKIRKEYDRKYGGLMETLEAGTGKKGVDEVNDAFTKFYESKGIKVKRPTEYSARDLEVLARAEADEIIKGGIEDVAEEVDRLAELGADHLTEREKAVFKVLAEHRQNAERSQELAKIGVTEDEYNSEAFKDFRGKFAADTPIADIYDIYRKTQPKKEIKTMGSMRNTTAESGVKDFYTYEESLKFTKEDFDRNPKLYKAVCDSMTKW